jgi:hypothetical protein
VIPSIASSLAKSARMGMSATATRGKKARKMSDLAKPESKFVSMESGANATSRCSPKRKPATKKTTTAMGPLTMAAVASQVIRKLVTPGQMGQQEKAFAKRAFALVTRTASGETAKTKPFLEPNRVTAQTTTAMGPSTMAVSATPAKRALATVAPPEPMERAFVAEVRGHVPPMGSGAHAQVRSNQGPKHATEKTTTVTAPPMMVVSAIRVIHSPVTLDLRGLTARDPARLVRNLVLRVASGEPAREQLSPSKKPVTASMMIVMVPSITI